MKRPQDAIPGIFRPPATWLTDPTAVDRAVQDVLNADQRSAPARRTAMQLVDHFTLHELPLPPTVRTALARVMRVTRVSSALDRQRALAHGEEVDVEARSKRRLRSRPEPNSGTLAELWAQIEQYADRGVPISRDSWWAIAQRLKVSPPRRRQRLVGIRKISETDGDFVWKDKPPEKRHGKLNRDKDVNRAMAIEAQARIVRGRHDVKALPYLIVAKLANILDENYGPDAEGVKAWGASSEWKLSTSATAIHPIRNGIEREADAMMRGAKLSAEELATWVREDAAIVKAWRREMSAEELAQLIVAEANRLIAADGSRLRDPKNDPAPELAKCIEKWWSKDASWDKRVLKRYEFLLEFRKKSNAHRKAGGSTLDIIKVGHELLRTRKTEI